MTGSTDTRDWRSEKRQTMTKWNPPKHLTKRTSSFFLTDHRSMSLVKCSKFSHAPMHERTRGVNKLLYSISLFQCSLHLFLFLSTSCFLFTLGRVPEFDLAQGSNTPNRRMPSQICLPKNSYLASFWFWEHQKVSMKDVVLIFKPMDWISRRRPSSKLIDVLKTKKSPDNRSKWGWAQTLEQTSVNLYAVK